MTKKPHFYGFRKASKTNFFQKVLTHCWQPDNNDSMENIGSNLFNQLIMARVVLYNLINDEFRVYVFVKAGLSIVS